MTEVRNVPLEDLGIVVDNMGYDGAVRIECLLQPNGKWTVRAWDG